MKSYSISAEEVKKRKPNQYKMMVEQGTAVSNWSTEHLPYSNKTTKEALKEALQEAERIEDEILNNIFEHGEKE